MAELLLSLNYFWHGDVLSPSFGPEFIMAFDSYSREWGEVGVAVCFLVLVRHHCEVPLAVEFPNPLLVQSPNNEKELFTSTALRRPTSSDPWTGR
jgi:hypothetical protein